MSEVEETIKRIQSHKGVIGIIVVSQDGKSSLLLSYIDDFVRIYGEKLRYWRKPGAGCSYGKFASPDPNPALPRAPPKRCLNPALIKDLTKGRKG